MEKETKVFEITANPKIIKRIERFLALLHFNSVFGHSGLFAMPLDGCGNEKVEVKNLDKQLSYEVDAIGGVGYDVEIARNNSYDGGFFDKNKESKWYTGQSANLYKKGNVVNSITIPSRDWEHPTNQTEKNL